MDFTWYILLPVAGCIIGGIIGAYNHKKYNRRKRAEAEIKVQLH